MKRISFALFLSALVSVPGFGSSVILEDLVDFRVNGVRLPAGEYQVRWGQIIPGNLETPSVFSLFPGNAPISENDGYFAANGVDAGDLFIALTQDDNTTIPAGVYMGLAITTLPYQSGFAAANESNTVILWGWNWITPTFTTDGPDLTFSLSTQTQVAYLSHQGPFSTYNYNGGGKTINLITVPEPSAFAAMTGFGALGLAAFRRRRRERR